MKKSSYTPAPWHAPESVYSPNAGLVVFINRSVEGHQQRAELVVPIEHEMSDEAYREQHANAKIIALAPRMADLLLDLSAFLSHQVQGEVDKEMLSRYYEDVLDVVKEIESEG